MVSIEQSRPPVVNGAVLIDLLLQTFILLLELGDLEEAVGFGLLVSFDLFNKHACLALDGYFERGDVRIRLFDHVIHA